MPLDHIQPDGLFASEQFRFTQAVTSPAGKLVFVSGQVGFDENAQVVGGDDLGCRRRSLREPRRRARKRRGRPVAFLRICIANDEPRQELIHASG